MLQLPVIIVLTFSVFVGRVYPVMQKGGHEASAGEITTNAKNVSDAIINKANTTASSVEHVNNTEVKLNGTKNSTLSEHLTAGNETVPLHIIKENVKNRHNCTSTKEEDDMKGCYVTPHDDDDVTVQPSRQSTEATTTVTSKNATVYNTEASPSKDSPKNLTDIRRPKDQVVLVPLNKTPPTNHTVIKNITDVSKADPKAATIRPEEPISSVAPLLADNIRSKESERTSGAAKSIDPSEEKSMPSGIIALVTAISFAIAIVLVYMSMVAWRRYVEYRYGHRELLVNELEFDTNDLRHFEL